MSQVSTVKPVQTSQMLGIQQVQLGISRKAASMQGRQAILNTARWRKARLHQRCSWRKLLPILCGRVNVLTISSAIFLVNFALAVWALIPTAAQRAASKVEFDDMQMSADSPVSDTSKKEWEMTSVTRPVNTVPYTPRTLAFNTLDRQLPLRAQQSQGRWA